MAVLAVLAAAPFARVARHPFVRFDDYEYIVDNPLVNGGLSWAGIVKAFTSVEMGYWLPATWISHMADVSFFGMSAGGHHLVNVTVHAAATALLFLALHRLTGAPGRSALAAALFGVHPLRVESVAWATERKDVLCALFFALALLAWERYARRPGMARYLLALLVFSLGLLAKPTIVTLPVVLLLLDFWPLGRLARPGGHSRTAPAAVPWRRLFLEKVPFFLLAAAFSVITLHNQTRAGTMKGLDEFTLATRAANALAAPAVYLGKTLWPAHLAVFYPHPGQGISPWKVAGGAALLAAITFGVLRRLSRQPWLAIGWGWYLVMLLPVLGLFQSGMQATADRFTYLPHAGLFVAAGWLAVEAALRRALGPAALAASSVAVTLLLAAVTAVQTGYWKDSVTLFTRSLELAPDSWLIRNNLGIALLDQGRAAEAEYSFGEALRLRPGYAPALYNLGIACEAQGRVDEAIGRYREALQSNPGFAAAHLNLGAALGRRGEVDAAVRHLREAVRGAPGSADAHFNLGVALEMQGRQGEALVQLREAARLAPADEEARRAVERVASGVDVPRTTEEGGGGSDHRGR